MYRVITFMLFSFTQNLFAQESLPFKKELVSRIHWIPYSTVLMILVILLLILAKYSKKTQKNNLKCKIIEKIVLHNKTKVFVIDYQEQHFLIADNQNSLAIHALKKAESS